MSRSKIAGIYKITLKEDGRCYIGSSVNIHNRWYNHKKANTNQVISRALKKYGFENFEWEIIEKVEDHSKLIEREQFYLDSIKPFVDNHNGFNVRKQADNNLGIKASEDTRKKQSLLKKGKKLSKEHVEQMKRVWHKHRDQNYYESLSRRITGDNNPARKQEVKDKISKSRSGSKWADEANYETRLIAHKKLHSHQMKKLHQTQEFKDKLRSAHLGSKRSDESKEKMSAWQQRSYKITAPSGEVFFLQSKDLKEFCARNKLGYPNLQQTSKTLKPYKGWVCKLVN